MPRNTAKLVNATTALRCLINKPATNNTTQVLQRLKPIEIPSRAIEWHGYSEGHQDFVNGTKRSICPSYFLPN